MQYLPAKYVMREYMTLLQEGGIMDMMYLTHLFNGIQGGEPLADVAAVKMKSPGILEIALVDREDGSRFVVEVQIASFRRV